MFTVEPSQKYWAVQILTHDYLIDGYIDGDRDKYIFRLIGHDVSPIAVVSARLRPTGILNIQQRGPIQRMLVYGDQLIALIPHDEVSLTAARQTNASFKIGSPGEVYVGPYLIRGKVMSLDSSLRVFATYNGFVIEDAEISCLTPDTPLTAMNVPYVLVMSRQKQAMLPSE
ncbi:MAG TPA: hypothetical protein VGJ97_00195 [Anaerolineaceae bacterium]|jgi:hypothetical protein